jgi:hypothetical protein
MGRPMDRRELLKLAGLALIPASYVTASPPVYVLNWGAETLIKTWEIGLWMGGEMRYFDTPWLVGLHDVVSRCGKAVAQVRVTRADSVLDCQWIAAAENTVFGHGFIESMAISQNETKSRPQDAPRIAPINVLDLNTSDNPMRLRGC